MDRQTAEHLAKAATLSADVQRMLWDTRDPWVRRSLAARQDLLEELAVRIVSDDDLITRWGGIPRAVDALLETAVRNALSEHSQMNLITTQQLTREMCEQIAVKCSPNVGWELVAHHELEPATASRLVQRFVSSMSPMSDGPGRVFEEHLKQDAHLWAAAASATGWGTLPVLRTAASQQHGNEYLTNAVIGALESLDHQGTTGTDERTDRTLASVVKELLRDPHLSADALDRLSKVAALAPQRPDLIARRSIDIASLMAKLDCGRAGNGDHDEERIEAHVAALRSLSPHLADISVPGELIAYEALRHRAQLGPVVTQQLISTCRGRSSRSVAARVEQESRIDDLVALTELMGTLVLEDVLDPLPVLIALATVGSREITDRSVPEQLRPAVALVFRPLRELLSQPVMLSVVLESLGELDERQAETALHLIGEWEGDLRSLCDAARNLVGD
jgi:hypothetical protein